MNMVEQETAIYTSSECGKCEGQEPQNKKCGEKNSGINVVSSKILRRFKAGYVVHEELWDNGVGDVTTIKVARTPNGDYIGTPKDAHRLCVKWGINTLEKTDPEHCVCSIGFNETEQKWYGWSHRAIFGFEVGHTVEFGDCGYFPKDKKEFVEYITKLSLKSEHHDLVSIRVLKKGIQVTTVFTGIPEDESQDRFIGEKYKEVHEWPTEYGRGEWTAETLEDCKQMAIDFTRSVS